MQLTLRLNRKKRMPSLFAIYIPLLKETTKLLAINEQRSYLIRGVA